jgi:acyl-CoA hydrolase/N-acetylglutamate synthase-like GNAT family acetyltransferase
MYDIQGDPGKRKISLKHLFRKKNNTGKPLSPTGDGLLHRFTEKIGTPEQAVSLIKPGNRVFIGTGCAVPTTLLYALEHAEQNLEDVKLYHFFTHGAFFYENDMPKSRFHHKSFYVNRDMATLIKQGNGDYIPVSVARIPKLMETGGFPVDVALIQVSMPDPYGYVSLGISCDITHAAIQNAACVIAELNPNMPRTSGETALSMDRIDKAVIVNHPLTEYVFPEVDPSIARRIAGYISRIIEDGSTLQIGLGEIPNAAMKYLSGHRDLGIHSDVITDSIIDLIDSGMINGKEKTLHKGLVVASYCLGSRKLYDRIHNNPLFSFHPMEYVCDPSVLAENSRLVSITQAQAVDLMGQVCSDQFHQELSGGISSQPDFIRGAASSPRGRPIICLASTTSDGKLSRIRPFFNEGEGITIPHSDVHYVVTECGAAYLFGKSIKEKALALIEIAHPSFRPSLLKEARRLGYIRKDQDLKCKSDGTLECHYPQSEDRAVLLNDQTRIVVRPAKASDVTGLQDLFYKLPPEDIYTRFFRQMRQFSISEAEYFCNVDYEKEMALIATVGTRENEQIIGSSFYVVDPSTNMAEVAYMILHEWHGRGIGKVLQERMAAYAKAKGIKGFKADILCENAAMIKLAKKCGSRVTSRLEGDLYEVEMLF